MGRHYRKIIADETLRILAEGTYRNSQNKEVSIAEALRNAIQGTVLIRPSEFANLTLPSITYDTKIQVYNETTFSGAQALLADGADEVCSLNFASAKNPGGGFLGGAEAQEEALSRASGLYECLRDKTEYYTFHRRKAVNCLYSHQMLYSPNVPVFRNDRDELLDRPWYTSIITSPAVNYGALRRPGLTYQAEPVMRERINRVLRLALAKGHRNIVLGAWGTGVFQNDPNVIVRLFKECLTSSDIQGKFQRVRFSVLDQTSSLSTFIAFDEVFEE